MSSPARGNESGPGLEGPKRFKTARKLATRDDESGRSPAETVSLDLRERRTGTARSRGAHRADSSLGHRRADERMTTAIWALATSWRGDDRNHASLKAFTVRGLSSPPGATNGTVNSRVAGARQRRRLDLVRCGMITTGQHRTPQVSCRASCSRPRRPSSDSSSSLRVMSLMTWSRWENRCVSTSTWSVSIEERVSVARRNDPGQAHAAEGRPEQFGIVSGEIVTTPLGVTMRISNTWRANEPST